MRSFAAALSACRPDSLVKRAEDYRTGDEFFGFKIDSIDQFGGWTCIHVSTPEGPMSAKFRNDTIPTERL